MTEDVKAGKRFSGGKIALIVVAAVVLLLLILYLYISSRAFVQSVLLPRVSEELGADVTAEVVNFRPFSELHLRQVRAQTPGYEPLLQADELLVRYHLWSIIRGVTRVRELTLVAPVLHITQRPDGTSNLDPIAFLHEPPSEEISPVDIRNLSMTNGVIRFVQRPAKEIERITELANLSLQIDQLQNNAPGNLRLAANVRVDRGPTPEFPENRLAATLDARFAFVMDAELTPVTLEGDTRLHVAEAEGLLGELAQLSGIFEADFTLEEVRTIAMRFERNDAALGQVRAHGPFSIAQMEGRLNLEVISIDRQALNLAGAPFGIDFGPTTINSINVLEMAGGGARMTLDGRFMGSAIQVAHEGRITPRLDLEGVYDLSIDQERQTATVETFTLSGAQEGEPVLRGELTLPMRLDWGAAEAVEESAFALEITDLNLAPWEDFLGLANGRVRGTLNVLSRQAGRDLSIEVDSQITEFSSGIGEERFGADAGLRLRAQVHELHRIEIDELRAELSEQQRAFAVLTLSGPYNLETEEADLEIDLQGDLPALTALLADPDLMAGAGTVRFTGRLLQQEDLQDVSGRLVLTDFTGQFGDYEFDRYTTSLETRVERREHLFQIHRAAGEFHHAGAAAGRFDVTGQFDSEGETGQFQIALEGLNEHALGPVLQPMLGERRLVSVSLDGQAEALYDAERDSVLKGQFDLANLVVTDPERGEPTQPLSAGFTMDAAIQEQRVDLRQMQLALSPTDRGENRVQLRGQLDISDREAIAGQLALISDSLDITPFYDLYAPAEPVDPAEPTPPPTEPDAVDLPVRRLVVDFNIGEFFLREVEMTKLAGALEIAENRVIIEPIEPTLNGAPILAGLDVNLGVPGYAYDVRFSADQVPLGPLVNSFMPESRGQYRGLLIADTHVRGAGITGANMRRALAGHLDLSITNANIQLISPRIQAILVPIAAILQVEEITRTPLHLVNVRTEFGGGNIQMRELTAMSGAFMGRTQGTIPIVDDLLQSPLRMPLEFHLRRSLAARIRAVPADTPPEVEYIRLPNFVSVVGTFDDPKPEIDRRALAGSILKHLIPAIPGISPEVGDVIRGFGDILRGVPGRPRQQPQPQEEPPQEEPPQEEPRR